MSKPRTLSDLVPGLTKNILGKKGALFGKLLAEWPHVASADIAAKTMPLELKFAKKTGAKAPGSTTQAVLHLAVQSAYALEISYQKSLLIERLNMFFGYPAIKDIKIIQQTNVMGTKKPLPSPARPLTLEEQQEIEGAVSQIQENDLQTALKDLGKAIVSRQSKG